MNFTAVFAWIKNKFTILRWLPRYSRNDFIGDVKSGTTVGVIEIPQVMAYAVIAGLSPIYGLYGSLVPLLIYPLFGTSRHLSLGIVATDMIIIASGAAAIAEPGTERYISVVLCLTLLVGVVHMCMSVLRMGFIVNLLSKPVIYGFIASAPLIIGFSQLGNLLGIEVQRSQYIYVLLRDAADHMHTVNPIALIIGIAGIFLLVVIKRIAPLFPRALVLLGLAGLAVYGFDLRQAGIDVVGEIPSGLPSIWIPDFTFEDARKLVPTVTTLVLIQLMSVISLGKTFANKYRYPLSPNREFFALGAANLVGSFFQSPPISASFSRTAISEQTGVRSAISNVVCAAVIALTLLFLTPLFYYIPIPALAAIIIVATLSMIDVRELRYFFRTKRQDGYIALFTFLSVLIIGIQEGILLGIGASLFAVLYRSSRPNIAVLGHVEGSSSFRDISRHLDAHEIDEILILRLDASFSFNNAEFIKEFVIQKSEERGKKIRAVILNGISINDLDTTAIEALQSIAENLNDWGITLHFSGLKGPVRDTLLRSGLARRLGGTRFHMSTHRAVKYLLNKWDQSSGGNGEGEAHRLKDYLEDVE